MLTNLRFINAEGGIMASRPDGTDTYIDPGSDLHGIALSGLLGEIAPYVPPPVPSALSAARARAKLRRREFALALQRIEIMGHADVMAFHARSIPAPLAALIAQLPEPMREPAEEAMAGAEDFYRVDPLWDEAVAAGAVTDAQLDALFGIEGD